MILFYTYIIHYDLSLGVAKCIFWALVWPSEEKKLFDILMFDTLGSTKEMKNDMKIKN